MDIVFNFISAFRLPLIVAAIAALLWFFMGRRYEKTRNGWILVCMFLTFLLFVGIISAGIGNWSDTWIHWVH